MYIILYTITSYCVTKMCAWTSVEVWQCLCNGSIASVYNAKSSGISSQVCYPTRDLLRRLDQRKQGVTIFTMT